ncbi:MAG: glycosyltransferase family 2 protein [Lachnospiraceae bacterium]|nr:glycosyltransferase family 2 protein [Lachnospiraceae bacterium]
MEKQRNLTIFTPAYNRAGKLKRVYESLKRQTDKDFAWLIVDDGSTDETADVARGFQNEGTVDIKYIYRENGGKMRAHNTGVLNSDTELFLCLDSDDYLSDTAVNDILEAWKSVRGDERYAGIIAYKGESEDKVIYGNEFPDVSPTDSAKYGLVEGLPKERHGFPAISFRELYQKGFKGETTLVFRTELLRENLFPEIEGEKYVPEDVVYDRIDEGHVFVLMPKILTICELMEAGYTDRVEELRRQAPTGWFIYYYQRAVSWPWSALKIKFASHYLRFRRMVDIKYKKEYSLPVHIAISCIPGYIALSMKGKL